MDSPTWAMGIILAAALLSLVRVAIGPSLVDRAIGLEVFTLSGMGVLALYSQQTGFQLYYEVLILWAFTSFVATAALGMYLYKRSIP